MVAAVKVLSRCMKKQNLKNLKLSLDITVSLEEQIARRAHELFLARGGLHGNDFDDWLQAENEINDWHRTKPAGSSGK